MKRKLTKSRTNVVLTGTLGGIADYIKVDPTIVRLCYVFLSLLVAGFPGILLYIALVIIIPRPKVEKFKSYGNEHRVRKEAEPIDDDEWTSF